MEQEGEGCIGPVSDRKRQYTSLATQDWQNRQPGMPEMWEISRNRQARSFGLHVWRTHRSEVRNLGGYGQ